MLFLYELTDRHERNLIFLREPFASVLFEQKRLSCLEGKNSNSGGGASFQGLQAETWDIESQVVILFGNLHGHGAAIFAGS